MGYTGNEGKQEACPEVGGKHRVAGFEELLSLFYAVNTVLIDKYFNSPDSKFIY